MRWPIQRQLLLPVLAVVVVAIVGASGLTAVMTARWSQRRQEENLQRVVATLTDAGFPLTSAVLTKMSGLSGAQFVVFDAAGNVTGSTIEPGIDELTRLRQLPAQPRHETIWNQPQLTVGDQTYLAARVLVAASSTSTTLSLVVLYPEDGWWSTNRQVVFAPLVVGAAAALAVMVLVTILAGRLVQPIRRLEQRASAIAGGDFSPIELPARDDEIRDLSSSINDMLVRLARYEEQVRQNERLRTLGQLGSGVAHQLRNAATGAKMALELHQRDCRHPDREALDVAGRQLTLMETYLQRFLTLGRKRKTELRPVSLGALVDEVLPLVSPLCNHAKIELSFRRPAEPIAIQGDDDGLRQLLVNLLVNAIEAARTGTRKAVIVELERDGPDAILRVKDSGPGPAAELRERLFEPFATEKPDGTGLGLSVAREIADEHRGTLAWQRLEEMTCFVARFPACVEEPHGQVTHC